MAERIREKNVEESLTEQTHVLRYEDINGANRLFGGRLMAWIDETAGIVATRHCESEVTTACVDNLQFKESGYLNDMIMIIAKVTYVGNTSMEVRVDSYIEDRSGFRRPINRAYLTMVSIDEDGHPAPIKYGLAIQSESERAEWESAVKRVEFRKQRRKEGF
jgi:acyl-CoA hydrolase